ncbi:fatty-acyl-CoA synthase [Saccharopolyspora erythraea NRRL 2338]|uniref:Fatty acyl-AMP ligase n=1 Tax=Saccharopolyspora erythraea TaxID=1836 RepID=A0ABP3MUY9_SACER|nr:fatty acyl-AMP ligase [Saccharopolyspora erythraea]PFG93946.1 fatty-acyl-CoA synthase [Saccharopolyspora erythraea NRRL 2338]QRK90766.1 fatty acyl-AMP ligase [Saccharopolyspora erythraea]
MSRFVDEVVASARANAGDGARGLTTGEPDAPRRRTWAEVHSVALRMAGALRDDVRPGDAVAILAADPGLIAPAVQGVWLSGGSVTMLHQPTPRTDLGHWAQDTLRVLSMIGARLVLLGPPFDQLSGLLSENAIEHRLLAELDGEPPAGPVEVGEDATALLQLTSGSTADPKAVRITHGNLHSNMRGMVTAAELDAERDVAVSWLPLFHDMGMVGCLTVPMAIGMEAVKVTPADFLARPLLWPELISRHRGTVTAAPNFAYAVVGRRMERADEGQFDLSTLRFTLNGAEPIDPAAARAFTDAGARFGLDPDCMVCAFGMAESTLAVSFAPLGCGIEVDTIDAGALEEQRRAVPVDAGEERARRFALLGRPLPGLEVDVVDDAGKRLGEREVGRLRIRGDAVTPGYLTVDGPLATQDEQGWLDTGDEGYLVDGQVVICGRRKDVIIMGGRNIYPVDIERAACEVDGVRPGNAAAVRQEAGTRRERFAVVLESKLADDEAAVKALRKEVAARVVDAVGVRPSAVVVLRPGTLPKTPSGKLRRAATAELVPAD